MKKLRIPALTLIFAAALSLALPVKAAAESFIDVTPANRNYDAIVFCETNEFIFGRGGGVFDPDGEVTRGEFIIIWSRTFHARRHSFSDATKTRDELDNAIVLMQGMRFVDGVSATEFNAGGKLTREQAAKIAYSTYLPGARTVAGAGRYADKADISDWALLAVDACADYGLLDNIANGDALKPKQPITRGEVCQILYNVFSNRSK